MERHRDGERERERYRYRYSKRDMVGKKRGGKKREQVYEVKKANASVKTGSV